MSTAAAVKAKVKSAAVAVPTLAKALLGAAIAGLGSAATAVADGSGVSTGEWITIASAALVALGGVYAIPNAARYADSYPEDDED